MWWNTLLLAFRAIRRNVLRSFLTVLGIVIGVAAVITMVTVGNGATQSVTDQISSMGSNLLMIMPGQRFGPGSDAAPNFQMDDVEAIREQISGAQYVAPVVNTGATAVYLANNWSTAVTGTDNDYFEAGNWTLESGRTFNSSELQSGRAVCVIGQTVRENLFGTENPLGADLRIRQFACEVIGVLGAKGQSAMGTDQDDTIIMPLRTVQRRLAGNQDIGRIMVSVSASGVISDTQDQITLLLRERRKISAAESDDFRVMDTRQIADTLTSTTRLLTMLLGAVAAVSLLVGGIGIMNIMLVSVTERTREIGTRLAIGALEREVLMQFLTEALVLSCLGGLVGIILAAAGSLALTRLLGVPYAFDGSINLLAFVFSGLIGAVFGYFPARRAAQLNPIDALRHE
ncbi:ABC transporter permease [Elongatibacter sediminis]|uniref:ABC transporter permease n=1 Tax=Elongatibacter sediminis TaxID=3119006 RepID=A0AAW9R9D4_9GAMM